jgi:hypothetical protein
MDNYKFKSARGGGKNNNNKRDARKNKEKVYSAKYVRIKEENNHNSKTKTK